MENGFCTKCGAKLAQNADFCNNCGSQIEVVDGVPAAVPLKTDPHPEPVAQSGPVEPPKTYVQPNGHRPISHRRKIIGIAVGIIFLVSVPFIIFGVLNNLNLFHVGDLDYSVDLSADTNVILDIELDIGSLEIYYDSTLTNLFEAEIEVWGKPNSELADANNFILDNDTIGETTISFDSGDWTFWFWNTETFKYNIVIYFHPTAEVEFNVDAGTGSVLLDTDSVDYLDINDIYLESGTGSLTIDMTNSINTSIESLYLDTGTGSINANLGEFAHLNSSSVLIKTGTGTITLTYEDLIVFDDITWTLDTGTGSVNMNIIQNEVLPITYEATFLAESGTGSINVDITYNASIGIHVDADVGTGSIDIFGFDHDYESLNYATANNIYTMLLETGTGSVEVV